MNLTQDQFFGGGQPQAPQGQPQVQPQMQQQAPAPTGVSPQDFFSGNQQSGGQAANQPSLGGFAGNVVGSAGNFLGGIGNAVMHPIDTVSNLGNAAVGAGAELSNTVAGTNFNNDQTKSWDNLVNFYKNRYGSVDNFMQTAYKDPVGFLADASMLASGVGAGVGAIGKLGEAGAAASAVNAGDVIAMGGRTAEGAAVATPAMSGLSKFGEAAGTVGEKLNPINAITKPISAVANSNFVGNTAKGGFSQLTGIQPNDIATITKYPEEFTPKTIENYTRETNATAVDSALKNRIESLKETGKGYADIRAGETPITVNPDYLKNLVESKTGLTVEGDGTASYPYKLTASGDSSVRAPSDVNALQAKIMNVWSPEFAKGYLTPNEYLNFRSDLAKMSHYEGGIGKSSDLENLASKMRGQLNSDFRSKIPGLAERDAKFATQSTKLDELRQNILSKDNTISPHAANRIANALGKGKDDFLSQLEEISPGITKNIAVGKAIENIQALKGNVVGTYGRAAGTVSAAAAGLAGGPIGAVAAALVEHIMTSPNVAVPLLKAIGKNSALYSAVLAKFNVSSPALIAGQIGKMSKATQKQGSTQIKVRMTR